MSITEEFRSAIAKNDKKLVRIMIKDSIVVDPTLVEFNEMIKVAESSMQNLYDIHNGDILNYDTSNWNKEYMNKEMVKLIFNFSRERLDLIKKISMYVYKERISNINNQRNRQKTKTIVTKKEAGIGLSVVGIGAIVVGIVVEAPTAVIVLGAAATIGGVALAITDK